MDSNVTITIPGYLRDSVARWLDEYAIAIARRVPTDPEGHEQSLMESSRLLGAAGATLRLIEGLTTAAELTPAPAPQGPAAAVNGYPLGEAPYPYPLSAPRHQQPARTPDSGQQEESDDFGAFADQQGYRP